MKFRTNISDTLDDWRTDTKIIDACEKKYGLSYSEGVVEAVCDTLTKKYKSALRIGLKYTISDETYSPFVEGLYILDKHGSAIFDFTFEIVGYMDNTFFINGGHTLEIV